MSMFDQVTAMPTLCVQPDQVEGAAHGSTVTDLQGEELFYLMCRGIAPEEAKSMLTKGFIRQILGMMPYLDLRANVVERIASIADKATFQWRFTDVEEVNENVVMERDQEMAQMF
mmetsp:Transcript_22330/g.44835  ORF Transcript_22330/g.44835 Transcript_22330/m.44835 type:complete len:115 (+) Transcript_22330:1666-2010(+)